jgi:hypothetical protein
MSMWDSKADFLGIMKTSAFLVILPRQVLQVRIQHAASHFDKANWSNSCLRQSKSTIITLGRKVCKDMNMIRIRYWAFF